MKNCGCRRWRRIYARAAGLVHCIKGVFNYKMQIEDLPQSFFIIHHSFFIFQSSSFISKGAAEAAPNKVKISYFCNTCHSGAVFCACGLGDGNVCAPSLPVVGGDC